MSYLTEREMIDELEVAWATVADAKEKLRKAEEERDAALELLGFLWDKWENGDPCFECHEENEGSLGNAFQLSSDEQDRILALLKKPTK